MQFRQLLRVAGTGLLVAGMPLTNNHPLLAAPGLASSLYGHNLIVNGDAEAGPGAMNDSTFVSPPGWQTPGVPGTVHLTVVAYAGSGLDLSPTTPGPTYRGKNYFYGGPTGSKTSSASQRIDISGAASAIDTSSVTFSLSGWLGGYSGQQDYAVLRATFLDASGKVVGNAAIGPVTNTMRKNTTELLFRSGSGHVPSGSRSVTIDLIMKFYEGSDNDGMADNLSLVLTTPGGSAPGTTSCATPPPMGQAAAPLAPANAAMERGGAPVQFAWKAVSCAASYDLQVWLQRGAPGQTVGAGSKTLLAQRVSGTAYTLTTAGWAKGVYAWRMIGATADGSVLGAWSPVQTFTLQ